jgi:hypothetical protein
MGPTYFLYSGQLFHEAALPALLSHHSHVQYESRPPRGDDSTGPPLPRRGESSTKSAPQPRRGEDPGPTGPEGESVGEDEEEGERRFEGNPSPGPGSPSVPERGSPDDGAVGD